MPSTQILSNHSFYDDIRLGKKSVKSLVLICRINSESDKQLGIKFTFVEAKMDYEDDFSWRVDPDVDPQEHQDLLVVRFLIENGYIPEHFDGAPPPASKEVVANLEERKVKINRSNPEKSSEKCVICLKLDPAEPDDDDDVEENDTNRTDKDACYEKIFKVMPCSHAFHRWIITSFLFLLSVDHERLQVFHFDLHNKN